MKTSNALKTCFLTFTLAVIGAALGSPQALAGEAEHGRSSVAAAGSACSSALTISCIGPDLRTELTARVGCRVARDLIFRIDGDLVVDATELSADEFDRPDYDVYRIERGVVYEGFNHGEFAVSIPKSLRAGMGFQVSVQEFTIDGGTFYRLNCQAKFGE
jgi:hypothetical protein